MSLPQSTTASELEPGTQKVAGLRGGIFAVMVLRISDPYDPGLDAAIREQVERSPGFFADAPVVLDLKECAGCGTVGDFVALKGVMRRHRLIPVGVQNANAAQLHSALATDLAPFSAMGGGDRRASERAPAAAAATTATAAPAIDVPRTRIVTQPVRSGTQIYARGGDLVVLAPVSAGAEVIADGNVHIYGALRGRAIAGAAGDEEARIFVQRLEAELLCIAGRYLVSESIGSEHLKQPVQVELVDDELRITPGPGRDAGRN